MFLFCVAVHGGEDLSHNALQHSTHYIRRNSQEQSSVGEKTADRKHQDTLVGWGPPKNLGPPPRTSNLGPKELQNLGLPKNFRTWDPQELQNLGPQELQNLGPPQELQNLGPQELQNLGPPTMCIKLIKKYMSNFNKLLHLYPNFFVFTHTHASASGARDWGAPGCYA